MRPNSGRIEPGRNVEIQVLLQTMKEDPPLDARCKDKFLVQSVAIPSDTAEGLNVTIDSGPGSVAGIARVAAGTYPIGFFDINSLVKFQDQNPDKRVQAVLMVYDKPPFAIATTTKTGIAKPKDLEGKVLGAPAADGAFAHGAVLAAVLVTCERLLQHRDEWSIAGQEDGSGLAEVAAPGRDV